MGAATVVIEDQVLGQADNIVTILEVLVLHSGNGFAAANLHAGPVAAKVVDIAPLVQRNGIPAGLVVNPNADAVMSGYHHAAAFCRVGRFRNAFRRYKQEVVGNTLRKGDVVVGKLGSATVVVEDEVLA